jgi:hypothetical protein
MARATCAYCGVWVKGRTLDKARAKIAIHERQIHWPVVLAGGEGDDNN